MKHLLLSAQLFVSKVHARERCVETYATTRSPILNRVTLEPTACTSPATSNPRTIGQLRMNMPVS